MDAQVVPSLPIALITYPPQTALLQAVLAANLGASLITLVLLVRYLHARAYAAVVVVCDVRCGKVRCGATKRCIWRRIEVSCCAS